MEQAGQEEFKREVDDGVSLVANDCIEGGYQIKKRFFIIREDGSVNGLWSDFLSELDADKQITRASQVEFDSALWGWTVEILLGKFAGCFLPRIFKRRSDALESEVNFFNTNMQQLGRRNYWRAP